MDSKERSSSNARESLNGAQCVQPSISRRRACLTILETAVFGTAPIRRHGYAALQRTPRLQGARLSARRPQALGAAGRKSARVSPRARSPCSGDDGRCRLRRRGVRQNLRPRSLEATALPHRAQCPAPRPSAPAQVASCHWRPCSWMGLREWGRGSAVPRRWPANSTRAGGARRSRLWASSGRLSAAATGVAAAERRLRPGWRQRTARAGSAQGALRAVARSPLCLAAGWLFAARATAARCRPRVRARARCPWGPRGRARVSSRERGVLQIVTIHLPQNFCARIRAPCTGAVARLLLKQHC